MNADGALAAVDMLLSAATAVCLIAGRRAIARRGHDLRAIERHRTWMIAAFTCSAGFLALFVTRFVVYGFRPVAGSQAWRIVRYVLLFAHEPIAVISVPLAIVTLVLGLRRAQAHAEVARPTSIIWLISAITGVIIYILGSR